MACPDTSVLIDLIGRGGRRRRAAAWNALKNVESDEGMLCTTIVTVAELWVGAERSPKRVEEERRVETILAQFEILELTTQAAQLYGRIQAQLAAAREPIGDMDALIASIAMAEGEAILSASSRHFKRVPGLTVLTY